MDPRLPGLDLKTSLRAVADLAMPRICPVCGHVLALHEGFLCTGCLADLPLTHFESWSRNPMACRLNALVEESRTGGVYEAFSFASSLFFYNSETGYKRIPQALKYRRDFALGEHFAAMLASRLGASEEFSDVDLVVPVPLHWTRRLKRGYNQAGRIASVLAGALPDARLETGLLRRNRRTRTQTRLGVSAKSANVSGAFSVTRKASRMHPRHILLVDDVFTTGATLAACHRALRAFYGPQLRISAATLAYVGG